MNGPDGGVNSSLMGNVGVSSEKLSDAGDSDFAESSVCRFVLPNGIQQIPVQTEEGGKVTLRFPGKVGLYQFSVIADASEFNWDELYFDLNCYGNVGQRTGPWDFDLLNQNVPLVPSYWVRINGRKIGLWYFQRISLDDLAARRFRGRMAFHIQDEGDVELELAAYRVNKVRWTSVQLECDPEDCLDDVGLVSVVAHDPVDCAWYWDVARERFDRTEGLFRRRLEDAFQWAARQELSDSTALTIRVAEAHLTRCPAAFRSAIQRVEHLVNLPNWGNPREGGYGHNGDIGAGIILRVLSWCAANLPLEKVLYDELMKKLRLQGNRFLDQALLNRDYWGGSLLQDHGWRSFFSFGTAALNLYDRLPDAKKWLAYAIPRVHRALQAMPRDGVIPLSSYGDLHLYVDELTHFRDAYLQWKGEDIFEQYPFQRVIDYALAVTLPQKKRMVACGVQSGVLVGGNAFLKRIASKFSDHRAAYLERLTLENIRSEFHLRSEEKAYHAGAVESLLSGDLVAEKTHQPQAEARLSYFDDSGLAHYRSRSGDVVFSVRCAPWAGHHAYRRAKGPCDRIGSVPGSGHFIVSLDGDDRLTTPDFGYRMRSAQRSCLLIDNQGQIGDIGYPMSIPSHVYPGEDFECVQWDQSSETGTIRLDLSPAYPKELGVVYYTREFIFLTGTSIVCRDRILLSQPRVLSWLFHSRREVGIKLLSGLQAEIGSLPSLSIRPTVVGATLKAAVSETEVVWSYASASGRHPFDHVRYDSVEPVQMVDVDFTMSWSIHPRMNQVRIPVRISRHHELSI